MTQTQINDAIAKALGAKWVQTQQGRHVLTFTHIEGSRVVADIDVAACSNPVVRNTPNYYGSLDAMHEAKKILTEEQQYTYVEILGSLGTSALGGRIWRISSSDAPLCAKAFVKTLNLWQD